MEITILKQLKISLERSQEILDALESMPVEILDTYSRDKVYDEICKKINLSPDEKILINHILDCSFDNFIYN